MANVTSSQLSVRPPTRIRSVTRASRLLLLIASTAGGRTAKECADVLELPLATTHHLLSTLAAEGMLSKDDRRRYHLGSKVGALADAFQRQMLPHDELLAPLRHLGEVTAETAHLGAWRDGEIVVLASIEGVQAVRVASLHTGMQGAAHARATGKLLLALAPAASREAYLTRHPLERLTERTIVDRRELDRELEQIRAQGYAIDDEEFATGVACVAAPILVGQALLGAYSISAPLARFRERRGWLIDAVSAAARAGAAALRHDPAAAAAR